MVMRLRWRLIAWLLWNDLFKASTASSLASSTSSLVAVSGAPAAESVRSCHGRLILPDQLTFAAPLDHSLTRSRSINEEIQEHTGTCSRKQHSRGAILDERDRAVRRKSGGSEKEVEGLKLEIYGEQTFLKSDKCWSG